MKRKIALLCAVGLVFTMAAGCQKINDAAGDKVKVTIVGWPDKDADPRQYENLEESAAIFNEKYPEYQLSGDQYHYDVLSFIAKAEGKTPMSLR